MLKIANYVRAQSLEEAYTLGQKRSSVILGGMLWLKMENRSVQTAIDLCDLGLDKIEEQEDCFSIGAMVSLRALEIHPGLQELTQGAMAEALKHIVGVQFRNVATIGGSLYGRFGFSDVLTLFQVLDAKVELYHHGIMEMDDFAKLPRSTRDLLVRVLVPKGERKVCYLSQRNTSTDFPVLACAVSQAGGVYTCAVGARPGAAVVFTDDEGLLKGGVTGESAEAFGAYIAGKATFGSNMRGSAEYRKKICAVLVRRCLMQMEGV